MTSRERIIAALEFKKTDIIPTERHDTTTEVPFQYGKGQSQGKWGEIGSYKDIWGCVWEVLEKGTAGEVKQYRFGESYDGLNEFEPPYDALREADLSEVDEFCRNTDKFVFTAWNTSYSIFERMQFLRGTENVFMDLALDEPEVYLLRDKIHAFLMEQARIWCSTEIDALHISDDWGTQVSLLINPEKWRSFFKPMYREFIEYCHSKGKKVLMHSDGFILEIIPDLIEIGVDALNLQVFCMDIDTLAEMMHHRLCYWGEIDRQNILPFGTPRDCRAAVQRVADAFLKYGRTGVVGQPFTGNAISGEKLDAVYEAWREK